MLKKILLSTVFAFCVLNAQEAPRASLVEVETLKKQEVNDLQEFVGTVNFDKKSKVASQSSGIAKKINFEVGQKVKKDEILVQIDSDILDAQIKASQSAVNMYEVQLKNAKKNYERYTSLIEKKSISQKVFDDVKVEYDVANENLISFCNKIGFKAHLCNSETRKRINLSAVFVNNFVNHVVYLAQNEAKKNELDWSLFEPLMTETIEKLKSLSPFEAQTGPAKRNDEQIVQKHLALLSGRKKEIYELLSKSISETYVKK